MTSARDTAITDYLATIPEDTFGEPRAPGRDAAWRSLRVALERATADDADLLFAKGSDGRPLLLSIRRQALRLVTASLEPSLLIETVLSTGLLGLTVTAHRGVQDAWGDRGPDDVIELNHRDLPGAQLRIRPSSRDTLDSILTRLESAFAD